MIDAFIYFVLQTLGYRKYSFDYAFLRGIRLDHYDGWFWRPKTKKGTYRETRYGYRYAGYGTDK